MMSLCLVHVVTAKQTLRFRYAAIGAAGRPTLNNRDRGREIIFSSFFRRGIILINEGNRDKIIADCNLLCKLLLRSHECWEFLTLPQGVFTHIS